MKNLKNISKILIALSIFFTLASCKKDKDTEKNGKNGSIEYQGKTLNINSGDYRDGNGDGAWIYLSTQDFNYVQIRFKNLGSYEIPTGSFTYKSGLPYNTASNFAGGFVDISNVADEITGGTVVIAKNGDSYTITLDATTAKGPLKGSFTGVLEKI